MNVSLTPELEKFITDKVSTGTYQSASEVVREGLRLLIEKDEVRRHQMDRLRQDIQVGLDQLDAGQGIPADEVFAEVRRKSRSRRGG
jgi:antitoxin ParD1/3/4